MQMNFTFFFLISVSHRFRYSPHLKPTDYFFFFASFFRCCCFSFVANLYSTSIKMRGGASKWRCITYLSKFSHEIVSHSQQFFFSFCEWTAYIKTCTHALCVVKHSNMYSNVRLFAAAVIIAVVVIFFFLSFSVYMCCCHQT